jgi:hypothetical protein
VSYKIEWEAEAKRIVLGLADQTFAAGILDGADRLAAAPSKLSRPGGMPFYATGQRYSFELDLRIVTLFFNYSQDEETLQIVDVSILDP